MPGGNTVFHRGMPESDNGLDYGLPGPVQYDASGAASGDGDHNNIPNVSIVPDFIHLSLHLTIIAHFLLDFYQSVPQNKIKSRNVAFHIYTYTFGLFQINGE